MAKLTLLQMTQSILNSMSSDEVNSISDSTESLQIANIIQDKYYDIQTRANLPDDNQPFQLLSSLDATKPVVMTVPDSVSRINWIKYFDSDPSDGTSPNADQFSHDVNTDIPTNTSINTGTPPGYQYVTILPFEQFVDMVGSFNTSESNVLTYSFTNNGSSYTFNYKNNFQPHFCTVLSNKYVLFDTFNAEFDSTLQTSKTFCMGLIVPPFELVDSFIPKLDDNQFPLLLNEAKALAFYELKQMPHAKAEQEIKRQWSAVQKNKSMANRPTYFNELPDFGRRPNTGGYSGRPMVRLRG